MSEISQPALNGRRHPRINYHTAVTIVTNGEHGFVAVKGRSEDVSAGGAKIVCEEPLNSDKLYLRLLIPELADTFVESSVVGSSTVSAGSISAGFEKRFVYNTCFKQFVSDEKTLHALRVASGMSPSESDAS